MRFGSFAPYEIGGIFDLIWASHLSFVPGGTVRADIFLVDAAITSVIECKFHLDLMQIFHAIVQ